MMANDGISARIKELKTAIAAGLGRLSSPSQSLVIAFCSPGIVHHLDGSALAYLVGINQLVRRDQPETDVDRAVHSHEPGRELDQGASKGLRRRGPTEPVDAVLSGNKPRLIGNEDI